MKEQIEVHLFLNKSKTHPITPEERIKHTMLEMVKNGYVFGYWSQCQLGSLMKGNTLLPDFKVINIDWRNEKAVIEPITQMPKWDLCEVLLTIAMRTEWNKNSGYIAKGLLGMYFCHDSRDSKDAIKH